jgi:hypothetical protein
MLRWFTRGNRVGLKRCLLVNSAKYTNTCVPPYIFCFLLVVLPINTNVSLDNINLWLNKVHPAVRNNYWYTGIQSSTKVCIYVNKTRLHVSATQP